GKRHASYGVEPRHFVTVENALVVALEHALIDLFTAEVKAAWQAAYALLSSAMIAEITPRSPAPAPLSPPCGRGSLRARSRNPRAPGYSRRAYSLWPWIP